MHHLVDVILSDEQALDDVHTLLRLLQIEACAAYHHVVTMLNEMLNHIAQVEQHRTAIHQCDIIHCKRSLQLGVLEQGVQHYVCRSILLYEDHDTQTLAVTLIVDV